MKIQISMGRLPLTALIPAILIAMTFAFGAKAELLDYNGAESDDASTYIGQKCCSNSINITTSHVRSGRFAIVATVFSDDPGVYPHHRAEIALKTNHSLPGQSYWYGWSELIPKDWAPDPTWTLIAQWHAPGANVMQPLQLELSGSKWCWVNWIGPLPGAKYNVLFCEDFEHEKGQWVDWVVNVKWTNDNSGYIRIWKNGLKVVNRTGPTIYKDFAPYWKVGLVYDAAKKVDHTIYIDELSMGNSSSSYAEVAPR